MLDFVIGAKTKPGAADDLMRTLRSLNLDDGILYIGYPVVRQRRRLPPLTRCSPPRGSVSSYSIWSSTLQAQTNGERSKNERIKWLRV